MELNNSSNVSASLFKIDPIGPEARAEMIKNAKPATTYSPTGSVSVGGANKTPVMQETTLGGTNLFAGAGAVLPDGSVWNQGAMNAQSGAGSTVGIPNSQTVGFLPTDADTIRKAGGNPDYPGTTTPATTPTTTPTTSTKTSTGGGAKKTTSTTAQDNSGVPTPIFDENGMLVNYQDFGGEAIKKDEPKTELEPGQAPEPNQVQLGAVPDIRDYMVKNDAQFGHSGGGQMTIQGNGAGTLEFEQAMAQYNEAMRAYNKAMTLNAADSSTVGNLLASGGLNTADPAMQALAVQNPAKYAEILQASKNADNLGVINATATGKSTTGEIDITSAEATPAPKTNAEYMSSYASKIQSLDDTINNVEDQIRRQYGNDTPEYMLQGLINNRTKTLMKQRQDLAAQYTYYKGIYDAEMEQQKLDMQQYQWQAEYNLKAQNQAFTQYQTDPSYGKVNEIDGTYKFTTEDLGGRTDTIGNDINSLGHILNSADGLRAGTYTSSNGYTYNVYATREQGIAATGNLLKKGYYGMTLGEAAQKWIGKGKDISGAKSVITQKGLSLSETLSDNNVMKFMEAIGQWEGTLKGMSLEERARSGKQLSTPSYAQSIATQGSSTGYDPAMGSMYEKYLSSKMTEADWKQINGIGLNVSQFGNQANNYRAANLSTFVGNLQQVQNLATELKNEYDFGDYAMSRLPASGGAEVMRKFNQLKSILTGESMLKMKQMGATFGAMSEEEWAMLEKQATSLSRHGSKGSIMREIDNIMSQVNDKIAKLSASAGVSTIPTDQEALSYYSAKNNFLTV